MNDNLKLFKVELIGGHNITGPDYNESYVVAKDPTEAYQKVRSFLDKNDLCFNSERELKSVKLIAENDHYSDCKKILFIGDKP